MALTNIALEEGVFEYSPPLRVATFSVFVEEEQGFKFSHCSTSTATNLQIWRGVDTRRWLSFSDIADHLFFILWHVIYDTISTYLKRVDMIVVILFSDIFTEKRQSREREY